MGNEIITKIYSDITGEMTWASTSHNATFEDPCCGHGADFGDDDQTMRVYDALEAAWDDRSEDDGDTVTVVVDGVTYRMVAM